MGDPSRPGGATCPYHSLGGRQDPLPPHTPGQGPLCKFKKNYIKVLSPVAWATGPLSPLGWATGGHFRNFSKRTYIFEIFIFLNIKKKKTLLYFSPQSRSYLSGPFLRRGLLAAFPMCGNYFGLFSLLQLDGLPPVRHTSPTVCAVLPGQYQSFGGPGAKLKWWPHNYIIKCK